jgi:multiple sugar transport system permease protein
VPGLATQHGDPPPPAGQQMVGRVPGDGDPLSGSILAVVSIFVFISTWNNFLWPFIITSNPSLMTLPVGLVQVQSSFGVRYAQIVAAAILAGLPLVVVFMLFQRQIVRGVATTGLAGT